MPPLRAVLSPRKRRKSPLRKNRLKNTKTGRITLTRPEKRDIMRKSGLLSCFPSGRARAIERDSMRRRAKKAEKTGEKSKKLCTRRQNSYEKRRRYYRSGTGGYFHRAGNVAQRQQKKHPYRRKGQIRGKQKMPEKRNGQVHELQAVLPYHHGLFGCGRVFGPASFRFRRKWAAICRF